MPQQGDTWINDVPPIDMGGVKTCPVCGGQITGPFAATLADNSIIRKWGCSQCRYIWKTQGGNFKTAFDANPRVFG